MPSIGWQEIALILIILVVIFGTSRLPRLGKSLGQSIRGFKAGIKGEDDETDKLAQPPQQIDQASAAETTETKKQS
jgi:sec-independent protein translocase protein TatA